MNNKTKLSKDERAVRRIEERVFSAVKDRDVKELARLVTDDFVYRTPGNPEVGKHDFLKSIASLAVRILAVWGEELRVNIYSKLAVPLDSSSPGLKASMARKN
jgi:hypothetical protein